VIAQVEEFRRLKNTDGDLMTHNNRPVQPLGNRVVWFNEREDYLLQESGAPAIYSRVASLLLTLVIMLIVQ